MTGKSRNGDVKSLTIPRRPPSIDKPKAPLRVFASGSFPPLSLPVMTRFALSKNDLFGLSSVLREESVANPSLAVLFCCFACFLESLVCFLSSFLSSKKIFESSFFLLMSSGVFLSSTS